MGLAFLPAPGKRDVSWQGEGFVPKHYVILATLCPQDRAFLPCKETRGDRLEARAVLKLLQWQHELNQAPNPRTMDVPLCYFSFPPFGSLFFALPAFAEKPSGFASYCPVVFPGRF